MKQSICFAMGVRKKSEPAFKKGHVFSIYTPEYARENVMRTSREIAGLAIVYGTLGFRASLEVANHTRSVDICNRLLPWLEQLERGSRIESIHREILATSHGSLPSDFRTEAYWRGENAAVLGFSIQLFDTPDPLMSIDPGLLVTNLRILRPTALDLLDNASLRSKHEVESYCAYCLAVRNRFQLLSLPDQNALFDKMYKNQLRV